MKKVKTYVNHGIWRWDCPVCGNHTDIRVSDDVCPACYPGIIAFAYRVKEGYENKREKLFKAVPDYEAREAARETAVKYEVVLEKNQKAISDALRNRPKQNQNWVQGESVADLKRQNEDHGVK